MPLKKDALLEELAQLRDQLEAAEAQQGQSVFLCSDQVLKDMATLNPLNITDFEALQGVDEAFIERYARHFLAVIKKHKQQQFKAVKVSKTSHSMLLKYKDRLTNISRHNRNLFTGKLTKRLGVDMVQPFLESKLEDFIFAPKVKQLRLTTLKQAPQIQGPFHQQLTQLFRTLNREQKDRGSYDLYLTYPFVEGRLLGEGFEIKAPLLYYPVILERKGYDFYLVFNDDKDIVYNRDLILANHKFSNFKDIQTPPPLNELTRQALKSVVLPYYEEHHLTFEGAMHDFEPFKNSLKADFKPYRQGQLVLKPYAVLGQFRLHSSALQEDLSQIANKKTYNDLLKTLIETPYETYDYTTLTPFRLTQDVAVKEDQLAYINPLNHAQEKVMNLLDHKDNLVIWGPPGTGKSQTITSLVAKHVLKGERVAVVSEKKVALDVIHTRLAQAGRYAMALDDAQNKQRFYDQLKRFIDPNPPSRSVPNDLPAIDAAIKKTYAELDRMHDRFYHPHQDQVKLYTLYDRYLPEKQLDETFMPAEALTWFERVLSPLSIRKIQALESRFVGLRLMPMLVLYLRRQKTTPVLKQLRQDLTRSEKRTREQVFEQLEALYGPSAQKKRLIPWVRGKSKPNLNDEAFQTLFVKKRHTKRFIKTLKSDHTLLEDTKKIVKSMARLNGFLASLEAHEKAYVSQLIQDSRFERETINRQQKRLFDTFYTGYIERFEALNADAVSSLERFHQLMHQLEKLHQQKQQWSIESFEMVLYQNALDFSNTKRIIDIKRHLDATHKKSVAYFLKQFQLEVANHIKIWLLTPEVVSEIMPLEYGLFDLVIFDEASQMYVEKAIPTIYRARKVVIAGDNKQLRPSSLGQGRIDYEAELDEDESWTMDAQSLLDLARFKYPETILNYHYRALYEELIQFSNHAFYDGKLYVSPNQTLPMKPPIEYHVVKDGLWEHRHNEAEAKKVIALIKTILRTRTKDETIGVITFNVHQRDLIEDLLDQEVFKSGRYSRKIHEELQRFDAGEDRSLFVKNIENVQGDERDIIIFSTAYAKNKDGKFSRQFGWLNAEGGQNRLNVAVSRAKRKIHIVTSFYPTELHVEDLLSEGPKLFKSFMQYAHAIDRKNHSEAQHVLTQLSPHESKQEMITATLKKEVSKRLTKEGYVVHSDIGIGGYTIDVALYDEEAKRYLLGILCDSKEDQDVRNQYYHQTRFLASRGWTLTRVFAPQWYKDTNQEMRRIRKLIKESMDLGG